MNDIHLKFNGRINRCWSFLENRSIDTWTHGYHRYPAKFIPQVVKKLLETYTKTNDVIADVFAGCGTTLVECKIHGLNSVGVDINPVAKLITKAKIDPVEPKLLQALFEQLVYSLAGFDSEGQYVAIEHPRIDYWFRNQEKNKIAFLYQQISKLKNRKAKTFFLCSLSHILKNCSRWLQDSTKPQIDPNKKIADPFLMFKQHTTRMLKETKSFMKN